jgi:acetoin utilization protein AcuB
MQEPTIDMYMTPAPHSIGQERPLSEAHQLMRTHGIRHLPVLDGQTLIGVVSQRDLHLFETLEGVDPTVIAVQEAMTSPAYTVKPGDKIREVAMHMAKHKFGSALVVEHGKVVGIFTAVDGLVGLSLLLKQLVAAQR